MQENKIWEYKKNIKRFSKLFILSDRTSKVKTVIIISAFNIIKLRYFFILYRFFIEENKGFHCFWKYYFQTFFFLIGNSHPSEKQHHEQILSNSGYGNRTILEKQYAARKSFTKTLTIGNHKFWHNYKKINHT